MNKKQILNDRIEYLNNQNYYSIKMLYKLIITKNKGCCSNCDEDYNYRMNLKSVFDNAIFCYTCDSYQELKENKFNNSFKSLIEKLYLRRV